VALTLVVLAWSDEGFIAFSDMMLSSNSSVSNPPVINVPTAERRRSSQPPAEYISSLGHKMILLVDGSCLLWSGPLADAIRLMDALNAAHFFPEDHQKSNSPIDMQASKVGLRFKKDPGWLKKNYIDAANTLNISMGILQFKGK
jgi:hypothetical protein